ncbi:GTP-binding protein [Chlorogloea sp. CCALA 695]|uniref:GTP-binding protein n=1 Tax=Chlorogloea sp. CCALA 695 TaxID=2107693 RepID=UPI000D078758|nr:GTP-binding protein [Chlorogloea sp. CCALA 695]PSB32124.1 GTP-binding protein [Chlorogloea sp. CCALA 695]
MPESNLPTPDSAINTDLDDVIWSFGDIQAQLNYKQAQTALQELIDKLDLTPQERRPLEAEIAQLETMLDNLERQVVQIAAFGMVGRGKSSLLNALLGQKVFETGALHGVTRTAEKAAWKIDEQLIGDSESRTVMVTLPGASNSQVELIDTPGLDEVDGETRALLAKDIAQKTDLILFVIAGDMTKVEHEALSQLRNAGKPILLVFNKIDQYPQADRLAIYHKIRDERVKELLSPDEIVMAASSPLVAKAIVRPDGSRFVQRSLGIPQIEEMKLKILEILHKEGKALVALNTMLYADDVNDRLVVRKLEIRELSANKLIWRGVMTKSLAVSLNPVTVVDLFSGAVIDVTLILTLSKLYGIEMTKTGAIALLQKIALSMGGISASELLTNLGLSSLKSLLGLSTTATGGITLGAYMSVAVTQAAVAGVSTYGIGQVAKVYLAKGASWGTESPKAVVSRILESLDEASIMNRIKGEIAAKLGIAEIKG